jgi:hypothetical protein
LWSTQIQAQEVVDPALAACQAQVQKLAQDVVMARLEALRKTDEAKKYDEAVKQQNALKPATPQQAKQ